jgi:adenylate cyclase
MARIGRRAAFAAYAAEQRAAAIASGWNHALVLAVFMIAVALVLVAALVLAGWSLCYRSVFPFVNARRRAKDDEYLFNACASGLVSRFRWVNRRLPADPRCRTCLVPFGGVGRVFRVQPSRKNPNYCMSCFEMAPLGATDMQIGVLFADLRGFTSWCEGQPPEAVERALNRFYTVTTSAVTDADGLVDKLVGDEVIGLFLPVFPALGDHTCGVMVSAAERIIRGLNDATSGATALPVGIGLNFGIARVGNVGAGVVKDFTAVGDVVNTAARLQDAASAGEIVVSEAVYERISRRYPKAAPTRLDLRGKAEPVLARVLAIGD